LRSTTSSSTPALNFEQTDMGGRAKSLPPVRGSMEQVISKIRKNASEEIWVSFTEYAGQTRLDLRIFFRSADVPQPKATRKGISLELRQVPELLAALKRFAQSSLSGTEVISKNKSNDIHIYSASFAERQLVHVLTFYREDLDAVPKPSPKGIAFDESLLDRLIEAVARAERERKKIQA